MNRHRDNVALVMDSADFRRDSHVRARTPGLGADLDNVIVRPTILIHDRRYERRVEAAAGALAMQAAKLHALLAEPLTRPLGSMQTPRCFAGDEAITLIQSKPVGAAPPLTARLHEPARMRRAEVLREMAYSDDHPRHVSPLAFTRESGLGGDYQPYKEQPAPTREALPADDQQREAAQPATEDNPRHIATSDSMRGSGLGGDRHHARQGAPSESMRELGPGGDHHYAAGPWPMRDMPRDGEQLRHVAPSVSLRECESGGDRHCSARFAPLPSHRERERPTFDDAHTRGEREAALGGERHRYAPRAISRCEELPTDDRLRSQCEAAANAGTYHGLRHVREHAHARLESLEAAAVSGKTAAARPHNAARARNSAADALRQPDATPSADRSAKPRSSTGKRRRGEGLTDARNALRRAYAESKLRLPNAPPRSSARSAGVVDGWERLPDKKARRARSRRKGSRAIWPWAAALAASSMFFAYALTLTVVSEPKLAQPLQPMAAEAAPKAPSSPPAPIEQPPAEKPTVITRPRATGPKSPKQPTRPIARTECRDQAPSSN